MNFKLTPFRACDFSIYGNLSQEGENSILSYNLVGNLSLLKIPSNKGQGEFKDGLWEHTCFELFIKKPGTTRYSEYNFSPSGDYASYSFKNYREGDISVPLLPAPLITIRKEAEVFTLTAKLPLIKGDLSITAVVEEADGKKHYFALIHTKKEPDFHEPTSFIFSSEEL